MRLALGSMVFAGLFAAGAGADAFAACVEIRSCFAVTGDVKQCSASKIDGERVARLELSDVTVTQAPCGFASTGEPEAAADVERRIRYLASYDVFYATTSELCDALTGDSFTGGVGSLCCDTVPGTGLCKLDAPIMAPKDPGWINPMRD